MSQIFGMNIEEVRQLASQLNAAADEIQHLMGNLNNKIDTAGWVGPDHDRFVGDWKSNYTQQLTAVMNALRDASQHAQQNALQQEEASN